MSFLFVLFSISVRIVAIMLLPLMKILSNRWESHLLKLVKPNFKAPLDTRMRLQRLERILR